jgi:hypothetical protein
MDIMNFTKVILYQFISWLNVGAPYLSRTGTPEGTRF